MNHAIDETTESADFGPRAAPALRWLGLAWKVIVAAGIGVLGYGIMVTLNPGVLTAGFDTYTDARWPDFAAGDGRAADFILAGFRASFGGLNLAVGFMLIAIAVAAFRHGQRWAWWALLIANTLAYGVPMIYDRVVGFAGVFETLEYVALFAVYVALVATAPMLSGGRSQAPDAEERMARSEP